MSRCFFPFDGHKLEEVLFSSGTDLVKTGLKVHVWSEMWLEPMLQTNLAGSIAGKFLKNSDELLCLGTPCRNVHDLVAQDVEARYHLGMFGDHLLGLLV